MVAGVLAMLVAAPAAAAQDSLAPPGAPKHWLPDEQWVSLQWLPFDEQRLYALLGQDRGDAFRWTRDEKTLAALAARTGWSVDGLADALVAPRRVELDPERFAAIRERTERVLTQGHLGQHLLFHSLHQTAIPDRASEIFGTRTDDEFLRLRRAELSPLTIGEINGRTRVDMARGSIDALRDAARLGVDEGGLAPQQAEVMLDRQLRAVPRWLAQSRYNGPSAGRGDLRPAADFARHPSLSADGSTVVWDAYRARVREAERRGEIHVRGADLDTGRRFAVSVGRRDPRRPRSAYNSVLSTNGRVVAFETSESTYPLAKRVGQMTVRVGDLATGSVDAVSHEHNAPGAPTRTAFNPSLSSDGRVVAFEATDAGRDGRPSRNGLWVVDRRARHQRLLAADSVGTAYLPKVSGNGRRVVYTSTAGDADGFTRVYVRDIEAGRARLVASAEADVYDPVVSHNGRVVAFVSRAEELAGPTRGRTAVFVRDLRTPSVERVSPPASNDVGPPTISRTGRFIAYLEREGRPDGTLAGLRSNLWLHDRRTGRTVLVSRANGRHGRPADGYNSEPSVSADGRRIAFTSTAGNLARIKPAGVPGVFVRDLDAGTTTLLSTHRPRRLTRPSDGLLGTVVVGGLAGLALIGGAVARRRP